MPLCFRSLPFTQGERRNCCLSIPSSLSLSLNLNPCLFSFSRSDTCPISPAQLHCRPFLLPFLKGSKILIPKSAGVLARCCAQPFLPSSFTLQKTFPPFFLLAAFYFIIFLWRYTFFLRICRLQRRRLSVHSILYSERTNEWLFLSFSSSSRGFSLAIPYGRQVDLYPHHPIEQMSFHSPLVKSAWMRSISF